MHCGSFISRNTQTPLDWRLRMVSMFISMRMTRMCMAPAMYGSCHTDGVAPLQDAVSTCVGDMSTWMRSNRLQMNTKKTEVLWCSSSRRQDQIPAVPLRIGADNVIPVSSVRDLGVYLDANVSMTTHISQTVVSCFGILRQIRSVQRSLPVTSLVTSLVLTRLDYCNSVLVGLLANLLNWLQAVINAAARLICSARKSEHITPILVDLHWLCIQERIQYKFCFLVFKCKHSLAPAYLSEQLEQIFQLISIRHASDPKVDAR